MFASLAILPLLAPGHGSVTKKPSWFDSSVAGYAFAYDAKHSVVAVHDPVSKFFLIREVECDGAYLELLLTRDRKEISDVQEGNCVEKPLAKLSTGKGISIGDSRLRILTVLGKPSSQTRTGSRKQFLNLIYHWDGPRKIDEIYTLKAGRLIEINFSWDDSPDGEASTSDHRPTVS